MSDVEYIFMSSNIFLNNTWVKEEVSRETLKYFKLKKMKIKINKICEMQWKQGLREVYRIYYK